MPELFGVKYDSEEEKEPKKPLISRRGFLKAGAVAAGTGILGVGGPSAVDKAKDTFLEKSLLEQIEKKTSLIKEMYGIKVKSKFNDLEELEQSLRKILGQEISGIDEKNSLSKYDRALDYIIQGFSRYPLEFVRRMNIRSIFIADNLLDGGGNVERITCDEGSEIFIEISEGPLNKSRIFGWNEKQPFNKTFDHEFFHVLDNRLLDKNRRLEWLGLDESGAYATDKLVENKKGFIDIYAQTSTLEDRASLFSAMMNNSSDVWKRCKTDEIIQRKILFLQQMMFSNTYGLVNQECWDLLKSGSLPTDFFKKRKAYLLSLDFIQFQQELKSNNWRHFNKDEYGKTEEKIWELYKNKLKEMKF